MQENKFELLIRFINGNFEDWAHTQPPENKTASEMADEAIAILRTRHTLDVEIGEYYEKLRDAVQASWVNDGEDGMFCLYCGAEVKWAKGFEDSNPEEIIKGNAEYICDHTEDCPTLIDNFSILRNAQKGT